MKFITLICFVLIANIAFAEAPASFIIKWKGRSKMDGRNLSANMPIKVGSELSVKDDRSFLDANYKGLYFRLINGELSLQEAHYEKGLRDVLRLSKGRAYFYLDKNFGNNFFQLTTPHVILATTGNELRKPTKIYVEVTKDATMVYSHKGAIDVTIPKIKKKLVVVEEGKTFTYRPGDKNLEASDLTSSNLIQRSADIFAQFTPEHDENEVYVHPSKRALFEKKQTNP